MARDFNGTTQYLRQVAAAVTAVPFTMAGWYRFDAAITEGAELTVLSISDDNANQEFTIEVGKNAGVDFAIAMANAGGVTGLAQSSVQPTVNTWQHLAGTFTSITRRDVFLNGINRGNNTTSLTPTGISDTLIGATRVSSADTKFFNGALAECGIWNRVLTDAEILTLSQGYAPSSIPEGLVFYCPVIGGSNSPEVDRKSTTAVTLTAAPATFTHPDMIRYPGGSKNRIGRPRPFTPSLSR